jgi:rare lipoprotein A
MLKMRANVIVAGLAGAGLLFTVAKADAQQVGGASWYALTSKTASGERMNPSALTAAHRTLPFGTRVRVENLSNGRSVVVRINDRGPFVGSRIIDVSRAAASEIGMIRSGVARVRVTVLGRGANAAESAPLRTAAREETRSTRVATRARAANARQTAQASRDTNAYSIFTDTPGFLRGASSTRVAYDD